MCHYDLSVGNGEVGVSHDATFGVDVLDWVVINLSGAVIFALVVICWRQAMKPYHFFD
jgi:hypothetical protein